jgi:hypothetical protein
MRSANTAAPLCVPVEVSERQGLRGKTDSRWRWRGSMRNRGATRPASPCTAQRCAAGAAHITSFPSRAGCSASLILCRPFSHFQYLQKAGVADTAADSSWHLAVPRQALAAGQHNILQLDAS